jgi:aminoglycoside 6'-N-acetyltransferase
MARQGYAFRPMTAVDLPTVRRWLMAPHVAEWWGDPDAQFDLVREDLAHWAMDQYIVELNDRAFAYLQCYVPDAWPNHGFGALPAGARGIDQFIGAVDMIDRGHGSALIGFFVKGLFSAGTPRVVTDPSPANARAIRAYEKAGFKKDRPVITPDGDAILMVCDP